MKLNIKKIALLVFLVSGCGEVNSVYYDGRSCVSGLGFAKTGADLYTISCASCHQPLTDSTKRGISALGISTAIAQNRGGMSFLSCLTQSQIQAIADALK